MSFSALCFRKGDEIDEKVNENPDRVGQKADWRRISRRVAPVAAVAALGTGILWLRKRQLEPSDLLRSNVFGCQGVEQRPLLNALRQRSDFAALQHAARRLRGPIEWGRECERAVARGETSWPTRRGKAFFKDFLRIPRGLAW